MNRKFIYIFIILIFIFSCKKNIQRITGDDPSDPSTPTPSPPIVVPPSTPAEDIWDGAIIEPNLINGNTYEIKKSGELAWIARESNKDVNPRDFKDITIKLMANLDFQNNEAFNGISVGGKIDESNPYNTFRGILDGNGKKIKNIIISTNQYVGFIGHLENGKVKNLGIEGGNIEGDWTVGGIVGNILYGTLENCYYTGIVKGGDYAGGLVGQNQGVIKNSYNVGDVYGVNDNIGGISGGNYGGTIEYCYNFGNVSGINAIGGIVGDNNLGTLINSFFLQIAGEINDGKNAIGDGGGIGSADPENYDQFRNQSTFSGWDFISVWKMGLDRPVFVWQ